MNVTIAAPYTTEQKGEYTLVLWPEKPTWLLLNEDGFDLFQILADSTDVEEFLSNAIQAGFQKESVVEFMDELERCNCFQPQKIKDPPSYNLADVWLNITRLCNLHCLHCDLDAGAEPGSRLTPREIQETITEALTLTMKSQLLVALTGGEPLMRKDFLDIVELLSQNKNVRIQIITNGTLINQHIAETLSHYMNSMQLKGVVLVSLDGATQKTHEYLRGKGTFSKTLEGIRLLTNHGCPTTISMCIHNQNFHEIERFVELGESLGVDHVDFSVLRRVGRVVTNTMLETPSYYEVIKKLESILVKSTPERIQFMSSVFIPLCLLPVVLPMRSVNCGCGFKTLGIDYNGDVYPCVSWMGKKDQKMGNIRNTSLKTLYFDTPLSKKLRCLNVPQSTVKCGQCLYKYFCGGGCRAETLFQSHTVKGSHPFCDAFELQSFWKEILWFCALHPETIKEIFRAKPMTGEHL